MTVFDLKWPFWPKISQKIVKRRKRVVYKENVRQWIWRKLKKILEWINFSRFGRWWRHQSLSLWRHQSERWNSDVIIYSWRQCLWRHQCMTHGYSRIDFFIYFLLYFIQDFSYQTRLWRHMMTSRWLHDDVIYDVINQTKCYEVR